VAGVAVALTGKASASAPQAAWIGDLLMIATALCGALFNVLSRPYLARMPAMIFTFPAMLAGATGLATIAVLDGSLAVLPALAASGWAAILFLGIFGAALTFWLWNYGLEHTTPTRVAITVTLNPIVAMALAVPLLGEPVTARLLLGLVGVIAGIALTAWQGPAEARAPARP
jgi:drug/metabolite transporter (DMT)-like permease